MLIKIFAFASVFLILFIYGCAQRETGQLKEKGMPALKETMADESMPWQKEWERAVAEAKKEGRVIVYSSLGSDQRIPLVEAFMEKFGLPLEFVAGRAEEVIAKMQAERRAGLHLVDAFIGGPGPYYTTLKPNGFLIPLKPELILPEVKDPNIYWQKRLPFTDIEDKYVFSFIATVSGGYGAINTNHVKKEELTSYYDLLSPRFKGKIILQDPTTAGKGHRWFMDTIGLGKTLNADYMKALAKQDLFLTRDRRQQIESLARGKFWVSIANQSASVREFIKMGTPLFEVNLKEDVNKASSGSGNIALIDKAPHPWAAKAFVNWLLTREVQTIFARASDDQSARIDVPADHLPSDQIRNPNVIYLGEDERFLMEGPKYLKLAEEIFAPLVK